MYDFYIKKSRDESLSEAERETYRQAAAKLARKGGLEELKAEVATKAVEITDYEDDDCAGGGCKI